MTGTQKEDSVRHRVTPEVPPDLTGVGPSSVLAEADLIINGARRADYGGPLESFNRIARLWEPIVGTDVTAEQVALCLIQLKVARVLGNLEGAGVQRDSLVDIAGYAGCLEKVVAERGIDLR